MTETTTQSKPILIEIQPESEPMAQPPTEPSEGKVGFMDRLDETEQQAVAQAAHLKQYAAGEVICREGDPAVAVYILQAGAVAVLKEVSAGHHVILGYRGQGEILGEMGLIGQQPRSASLIASEDTGLLCIDAAVFPQLADRYPGINEAILSVLNDRLQEAEVARSTIIQEEQSMAHRLELLTGEAERLAELARVRKETVELLVHDLRTPLSVVSGCLDMLRSIVSEERVESADAILDLAERSAQRLIDLSEDLLITARQESAADTMARRPVNVPRLLENAVENTLSLARKSGLDLVLDVADELPSPKGDAAQLQRVVDNLVDNAISYTPTGGRIVVAATGQEATIAISVTDTGPGVPTEHRETIFERFGRVPGLQGRRTGFGLGLYFCRQVVASHGGKIWMEPGPENIGSRFVFILPIGMEESYA